MFSAEHRNQLISTICVNVLTVCYGVAIGWPSASFLILMSPDTPMSKPLTPEEGSWTVSLLPLGGFAGNIICGMLSDRIGRKYLLIMSIVPLLMGWTLIYMAQNAYYLYVARALQGYSGATMYIAMPIYVAEIADSKIRGKLGSIFMLACNIGILLSFVLGHFCRYSDIPLGLAIASACYLVGVMFLPETPQYLMRTNQVEEAEKSLRFYRNLSTDIKEQKSLLLTELETLRVASAPTKVAANEDDEDDHGVGAKDDAVTWRDFTTPHAMKAFFIGIFLLWLKSFSGLYAMVTYAGQIFEQAGSSMSPNASSIVIGFIQLAGTYQAILLVERAGRRVLLIISSVGTGLSLIVLATYIWLRHIGWELEGFSWLPILSFSCVLYLGSCGIIPMPFVVMSEVMPPKIRAYGSSIGMSSLWIFTFFLMRWYTALVAMLGMHGCFYLFAVCSFVGTLFAALYLPETRGKSFDEIQRMMAGRRKQETKVSMVA